MLTYNRNNRTILTIIQFTFDNILLPDSTTNQEGSNGFVKFKIAQQKDLSDGTRLENNAAIFFDFNEPIITNTVFHTIGQPFERVSTDTKEILATLRGISVYPNPFIESTQIDLFLAKDESISTIAIVDFSGRQIQTLNTANLVQGWNRLTFEATGLTAGLYYLLVQSPKGSFMEKLVLLK